MSILHFINFMYARNEFIFVLFYLPQDLNCHTYILLENPDFSDVFILHACMHASAFRSKTGVLRVKRRDKYS